MPGKIYNFQAEVWLYTGLGAWHFITVPKQAAAQIRTAFAEEHRSWMSLPVQATVGKTSWNTSIFRDKKLDSYVLSLKAAIRKKEKIRVGDVIRIRLKIRA